MASNKLRDYLTLLMIRRTARRRDTLISGGIFLVSCLSMISLGLLDQLNGRSLYLVAPIVAIFGMISLMSWVKLEMTKRIIELIEEIQRMD